MVQRDPQIIVGIRKGSIKAYRVFQFGPSLGIPAGGQIGRGQIAARHRNVGSLGHGSLDQSNGLVALSGM